MASFVSTVTQAPVPVYHFRDLVCFWTRGNRLNVPGATKVASNVKAGCAHKLWYALRVYSCRGRQRPLFCSNAPLYGDLEEKFDSQQQFGETSTATAS